MLIMKILMFLLIIISGGAMKPTQELQINNYFNRTSEIIVYINNSQTTYKKGTEAYTNILASLNNICEDSHEMPAFSVSLDAETRESLKNGIWIELVFDETLIHNDMPFNSLLIEVNSDFSGFNLIRKHNNLYEGRCFYLNLEGNMSDLYNTIINL